MRPLFVCCFTAFIICSTASAEEVNVGKAQYLEILKKKLPESFCSEKTYFRKCYEVTLEKCNKLVAEAAIGCIAKLEPGMPARFTQLAEGKSWGEKIGSCVGGKFETESVKEKKDLPDCKDPAKWK